jgi:hypothetical protein
MMPTAKQMLEAAQLALREHVVPQVDDQWAESALRSVDVILSHLQVRVVIEGPMLHADTSELVVLLDQVKNALDHAHEGLDAFLAEAPGLLEGYAPVDDLAALNTRGRAVVDHLLHVCRTQNAEKVHADLRAYLIRHADREAPLFFPTYVGRPV